ncbi:MULTISPECIES: RHS repeat-associated core domain-containing protein [Shewanella]|uniref:RHS repeat-associated core domain-containing protein n=1 Tax=Shewanella TaxID=22 RepID=UPI001184F5F9|nr:MULTISPECIES: RHS repeat-associated core domain-containing protein [Shewanella]NDO76519.1 RHS repeat-associated core domain-containing protein [Shewanella sp. SE1]TVP08802.1 hypothetical protein AYI96_18720 [Shewanella sp. MSW]BCV37440.1 hypothetical protein TUM17377_27680 [Shewanella chilikensis]
MERIIQLLTLLLLLICSQVSATTVRYQHTDMLGSVVAESDSAGNITSRSHYEPFGKRLGGDKAGIGYTGHLQDEDLNLTYMQARYYDPLIGRFYANDPNGFRDIHSFNRYAYANNNPYKYFDPDGRETLLITVKDYGVSTHSATMTNRDGNTMLYDPAGSYSPSSGEVRGSGDVFTTSTLSDYTQFHESVGSEISVVTIPTTAEQEAAIQNNMVEEGGAAPFECAASVSSVLKDVGVKPSALPRRLEDNAKERVQEMEKTQK